MAMHRSPHIDMVNIASYSIRPSTPSDCEAIAKIERLAHYHPWSSSLLNDALHNYHGWTLLIENKIVGYGFLKIILDEAELLNIAIDPKLQGKGLGKYLLAHLLSEANTLNAKECFLEVRESNHTAYQLYEKLGFNEIGRRTNYYPSPKGFEDALIMACVL